MKSTCNEYNSVSFVRRIQPQENDEQELVMKGECVCVNTNRGNMKCIQTFITLGAHGPNSPCSHCVLIVSRQSFLQGHVNLCLVDMSLMSAM